MDKKTAPGPNTRLRAAPSPAAVARAAKRRKKARRKRIAFLTLSALAVCGILAAATYGFIEGFRITGFEVQGKTRYSAAQVIEASGIAKGGNIFFCGPDSAQAAVCKKLPYIGKAEIERKLPGTLIIKVGETTAYCAMKTGSGLLLLDRDAKALERKAAGSQGKLPVLLCAAPLTASPGSNLEFKPRAETTTQIGDSVAQPSAFNDTLLCYFAVIEAIEESGIKDITQLDLRDLMNVKLQYQSRVTIIVGTPDSMVRRLQRAVKTLAIQDAKDPTQKATLDVSIPKTVVFRPEAGG